MLFLLIRIATGPEKGSIEAENDEVAQLGQLHLFASFCHANSPAMPKSPKSSPKKSPKKSPKSSPKKAKAKADAAEAQEPEPDLPQEKAGRGRGSAGWFGSWRLECLDGLDGGFWLLIVAYSGLWLLVKRCSKYRALGRNM